MFIRTYIYIYNYELHYTSLLDSKILWNCCFVPSIHVRLIKLGGSLNYSSTKIQAPNVPLYKHGHGEFYGPMFLIIQHCIPTIRWETIVERQRSYKFSVLLDTKWKFACLQSTSTDKKQKTFNPPWIWDRNKITCLWW